MGAQAERADPQGVSVVSDAVSKYDIQSLLPEKHSHSQLVRDLTTFSSDLDIPPSAYETKEVTGSDGKKRLVLDLEKQDLQSLQYFFNQKYQAYMMAGKESEASARDACKHVLGRLLAIGNACSRNEPLSKMHLAAVTERLTDQMRSLTSAAVPDGMCTDLLFYYVKHLAGVAHSAVATAQQAQTEVRRLAGEVNRLQGLNRAGPGRLEAGARHGPLRPAGVRPVSLSMPVPEILAFWKSKFPELAQAGSNCFNCWVAGKRTNIDHSFKRCTGDWVLPCPACEAKHRPEQCGRKAA